MSNAGSNGNSTARGGTLPGKSALRDAQNENTGPTPKVRGTKRLNGTNENVMNARRRFDLELGRGKPYNPVEKNLKFSELKRDSVNVDHVNSTTTAVNRDQLRAERFVRLQKFLKQCDEASQRQYIKRLLRMSPPDLNMHAVDLEKRTIQMMIDEGNEMQRMKALHILAKSFPTNNSLQPSLLLQSNKR